MVAPDVLIVDGNNVLHAHPAVTGTRWLVDHCATLAAGLGCRIVIVFDGVGAIGESGGAAQVGPVILVESGSHDADTIIESLAREHGSTAAHCWVVTSDSSVRRTVGPHTERVIASDAFGSELAALSRGASGPIFAVDAGGSQVADDASGATQLSDRVDERSRERLEQLRQGRNLPPA